MYRRLTATAAALLALAACSADPPRDPYEGRLAEGVVLAGSTEARTAPHDAAVTSHDGDDVLRGRHSDLDLLWTSFAPGLTAGDADLFDAPHGRAPDGHEVLAAQFAPDLDTAGDLFQDGERPTAELVVNGEAFPIAGLPYVNEPTYTPIPPDPFILIATVPTGAAVSLRVTDSGTSVSLDLRTGKVA